MLAEALPQLNEAREVVFRSCGSWLMPHWCRAGADPAHLADRLRAG